ncbi:MAG: methyltransferase [Bacteroidetes bacterium]|nr:methyltransferase [Bacteroidota bacterium]
MNSRERIAAALAHRQGDRVPLDFGGTAVTGIAASTVYKLRQALKLDPPGTPVKVIEPFQVLGEIAADLRSALGIDCVPLGGPTNMFGFENADWKPWTLFDGTPVLVPGKFNTQPAENGDILQYPQGDRRVPPSGRMPAGGFYFDAVVRQRPIDDARLRVEDNLEEFQPISDVELEYLRHQADDLYANTEQALVGSFGGTSFGDIALVPGLQVKHPKGIRDIEEWYISTVTRKDYVKEVFDRQCELALRNLSRIREAVGDKVSVIFVTGTDFGTQRAPFISSAAYRELYMPVHKRVNDWVHTHTAWKTFIHSCGCVEPLISDFIEAGFDILNPVQCSAARMDPQQLKARYGRRIVFWGGGVDTQGTLPFGTPDDVRQEVKDRVRIFGQGGGFVFNTVHNIQAGIPVGNVLAMFEAFQEGAPYGSP